MSAPPFDLQKYLELIQHSHTKITEFYFKLLSPSPLGMYSGEDSSKPLLGKGFILFFINFI